MKLLPKSMDITIDRATIDDLNELQTIESKTFSEPWSRQSFEAELNGHEFSLVLVARKVAPIDAPHGPDMSSNRRIVGYICVWIVFEELRFMNIAVETDVRRQGIGSRLIKKAIKNGLEQGVQRALLEVRESNKAAQALYMQFGFEFYGRRQNYYTNPDEDAMLMALDPVPVSE